MLKDQNDSYFKSKLEEKMNEDLKSHFSKDQKKVGKFSLQSLFRKT